MKKSFPFFRQRESVDCGPSCLRMIGFKTIGAMITFEQLVSGAILPCILHWNQNHFVVCYDIKKKWRGGYKIYTVCACITPSTITSLLICS